MEKQQPRLDAECSLLGSTVWIQIHALPPADLCDLGKLTLSLHLLIHIMGVIIHVTGVHENLIIQGEHPLSCHIAQDAPRARRLREKSLGSDRPESI